MIGRISDNLFISELTSDILLNLRPYPNPVRIYHNLPKPFHLNHKKYFFCGVAALYEIAQRFHNSNTLIFSACVTKNIALLSWQTAPYNSKFPRFTLDSSLNLSIKTVIRMKSIRIYFGAHWWQETDVTD
jgi:hypothetical protein